MTRNSSTTSEEGYSTPTSKTFQVSYNNRKRKSPSLQYPEVPPTPAGTTIHIGYHPDSSPAKAIACSLARRTEVDKLEGEIPEADYKVVCANHLLPEHLHNRGPRAGLWVCRDGQWTYTLTIGMPVTATSSCPPTHAPAIMLVRPLSRRVQKPRRLLDVVEPVAVTDFGPPRSASSSPSLESPSSSSEVDWSQPSVEDLSQSSNDSDDVSFFGLELAESIEQSVPIIGDLPPCPLFTL